MSYAGSNPHIDSIVSSGDTLANLTARTRKAGVLVYATDTELYYYDDGTSLLPIDTDTTGFDAIDTKANLDALPRVQGKLYYASDEDKGYTDDGATLNELGSGAGGGIPLMALGSLLTSDGANNGELDVGADGEILVANSAAANGAGVEWQAPAAGGGSPAGSSTIFSGQAIPADYLESNGQSFDRTIETDLYAELGDAYNIYETTVIDVAPDATPNSYSGSEVRISKDGSKVVAISRAVTATGQWLSVYDWDGSTLSNKQTVNAPTLVAGLTSSNGVSISDDGTVIIVGNWGDTVGGFAFAGQAFIYKLVASVWTLDASISASGGAAASEFFARDVSISGDASKVLIGSQADYAEVYVDAGGGTWNLEQKITGGGASLGQGVAINYDGTVMVLGDPADTSWTGKAEVWKFSGSWTMDQDLGPLLTGKALNDSIGRPEGVSISSSGNEIVLGNENSKNSVWYLVSDGAAFALDAVLSSTLMNVQSVVTTGISGDGNTILMGCVSSDTGSSNGGATTVFKRSLSGTYEHSVILGTVANDFSGHSSTDASGITIMVGAPNSDTGGSNTGKIYAYTGPARVPTLTTGVDGSVYITKK
jgi:hypothetical protein